MEMGCLLVVVLDATLSIAIDAEIGSRHGGGRFLQFEARLRPNFSIEVQHPKLKPS